jgi:prepilin-type N-terminal cleavage/methylation domain-containing protein
LESRGLVIIGLDKKRAFTLIELLISIVILTLIVLFLSTLFETSYKTSGIVTEQAEQKKYERRVLDLLYYDIIESQLIKPDRVTKKYDRVDFERSFSLHGLDKPYVKWAVVEDDEGNDYLVRAEAPNVFSLNNSTNYYLDVIGEKINSFKIIRVDDFVEIYIEFEGSKPLHLKLYSGLKDDSKKSDES